MGEAKGTSTSPCLLDYYLFYHPVSPCFPSYFPPAPHFIWLTSSCCSSTCSPTLVTVFFCSCVEILLCMLYCFSSYKSHYQPCIPKLRFQEHWTTSVCFNFRLKLVQKSGKNKAINSQWHYEPLPSPEVVDVATAGRTIRGKVYGRWGKQARTWTIRKHKDKVVKQEMQYKYRTMERKEPVLLHRRWEQRSQKHIIYTFVWGTA